MSQTASMPAPVDPMTLPPPSPIDVPLPPPGFLSFVAELVHAHRARLLRYVKRQGLGPDDALDIIQDTFATFLLLPVAQKMTRTPTDGLKMLTAIARHKLMNHRRRSARREVGPMLDLDPAPDLAQTLPSPRADADSSEALLLQSERLALVNGCIHGMTRLQRAVILLSALDDRPHEDIGALLGISPGHVRVLLHRAREHVRACPFEQMPAVSTNTLRASLPDLPL